MMPEYVMRISNWSSGVCSSDLLLDEGTYLGSISTMYRLLRAEHQVRERRRQARRPATVKPELVATGPNQVWSWDITKLRGPHTWTWFQLYVTIGRASCRERVCPYV